MIGGVGGGSKKFIFCRYANDTYALDVRKRRENKQSEIDKANR